jgi:hypothetical protein
MLGISLFLPGFLHLSPAGVFVLPEAFGPPWPIPVPPPRPRWANADRLPRESITDKVVTEKVEAFIVSISYLYRFPSLSKNALEYDDG